PATFQIKAPAGPGAFGRVPATTRDLSWSVDPGLQGQAVEGGFRDHADVVRRGGGVTHADRLAVAGAARAELVGIAGRRLAAADVHADVAAAAVAHHVEQARAVRHLDAEQQAVACAAGQAAYRNLAGQLGGVVAVVAIVIVIVAAAE